MDTRTFLGLRNSACLLAGAVLAVLAATAASVAADEPSRNIDSYALFAYDSILGVGSSNAPDRGIIVSSNLSSISFGMSFI